MHENIKGISYSWLISGKLFNMLSCFFLWILNVFVSLILCVIEDVHVCLTVWMLFVCFLCTFHLNITIKYLMLCLLLLNHTRCLMATCQAYWYGSLVFTSYGSDTVYLPMTVEVWPWSLHSSWVTLLSYLKILLQHEKVMAQTIKSALTHTQAPTSHYGD